MALVAVGFRFIVGFVFLLAGGAKLPRRNEFERAVRAYGLLPSGFVRPVARALPGVEVALGVLMLLGLGTAPVASFVGVTLLAFSLAVALNLARGRDLDCGCFAVGAPRHIGWPLIARNLVLIGMTAAVAAASSPAALSLDEFSSTRGSSVASASAFALAMSAALAVLALTLVGELVRLRSLEAAPARADEGLPS